MKLIYEVIRGLLKEELEKSHYPSFSQFKIWLDDNIGKLIHKYMLRTKSMKVCSTISPEFIEIARDAGFTVGIARAPGHVYNVVLTSEGPYKVDLSAIQFVCKHDISDRENRKEIIANYKNLRSNPSSAISIEKLDQIPNGTVFENEPMPFDPVSSFKRYDIKDTEDASPEWFERLK